MIVEPPPQLSSSSSQLLDDPMIKDLIRIGSQFIGYREYASRAEGQQACRRTCSKLEQSEAARKKAELVASEAKAEADDAKAKAASVEELQKRLKDAESALDEQKTAQAAPQTNQDFDLDNPVDDPLLDALSLLEFHGREIREGVANAVQVGDTDQIEQSRWKSLIKAAKPNTKKILAYLGIKPSSTPSSSKPEV
ncbi:hypothetical protein QYE76_036259 [Lolium multiflorum]|uniref:Uncharacterized protein n=1 Tax=Lolium multiflorum TaxID=4521 RepID=A0AAD8R1D3_LOLMU|nr:hypothetical protein QYE76_036259 [Lolium multiflorum]